jgi:hypothetical protein
MYINFSLPLAVPEKATLGTDGSYSVKFSVNDKREGHVGSIYFSNDENGSGSMEWCRGNYIEGAGEKISLEELISFLESRERQD